MDTVLRCSPTIAVYYVSTRIMRIWFVIAALQREHFWVQITNALIEE